MPMLATTTVLVSIAESVLHRQREESERLRLGIMRVGW